MSNATATKTMSSHAHVAKIIRQHLKAEGIKGSVKADGKGSSSVSVKLHNSSPAQVAAVKSDTLKYKYGRFNGMTDGYEMTNNRDDIPQVAYLWVEASFDDEHKQRALDLIAKRYDLPAMTVGAIPSQVIINKDPKHMPTMMHQVLCGSHSPHIKFWADDVESEDDY